MTKKLSETERHQDLAPLLAKGWTAVEGRDAIAKEFKFANFREAMSFMFLVAFEAEQMDHHPDWKNVYNKVLIELTTHDKGRVTDKDYALAAKIDAIFSIQHRNLPNVSFPIPSSPK